MCIELMNEETRKTDFPQTRKTGSIFMKNINKFHKFKSIGECSLIIMQKQILKKVQYYIHLEINKNKTRI